MNKKGFWNINELQVTLKNKYVSYMRHPLKMKF